VINSNVVIGSISINTGASLTVNSYSLTINGNVTIASPASLTSLNVNAGSLTINGNVECNGLLFVAPGVPTTFSGAASQTVSGSGTATIGTITVNMEALRSTTL
jgi:hypothetical protein